MAPDSLLTWAQEHFLHGHLLTPWITDYIDLEASLSVGSIAQEELAHASLLMQLAGYDTDGRDEVVYSWDIARWAPSELVTHRLTGWPATVARGLLLSTAAVIRTRWMRDSVADTSLNDAAVVLLAEQSLHVAHWTRWVHRLSADVRTRDELTTTVAALLPLAFDLFDAVPADEVAAQQLRDRWSREVRSVFAEEWLTTAPPVTAGRRAPIGEGSDLADILAEVRQLRTTPDDGVLGRYR